MSVDINVTIEKASKPLKDFEAEGDGATDDTLAVQSALDSGFSNLDGQGLEYLITSELLGSANTRISNATFIIDGSFTDDNAITFQGSLELADTPTADISANSFSISVTDESIYSAGDYIYIKSDNYWSSTLLDNVKDGEVIRIKSTSANTLNLETPTLLSYAAADNFTIQKINTLENVILDNVNAIGIDSDLTFANFKYCRNVTVVSGKTEDFDLNHYAFTTCIDYLVDNVRMNGSGVQDGYNYGVSHTSACYNGCVINSKASNIRHLSTIGGIQGISRFINVVNCIGTYMTDAGIDAHSAVYEHSFLNNEIEISPTADTTQDGIISQGAKPVIRGNKIRNARRHGVYWQPLLSTSMTDEIFGDIKDNEIIFNQSATGTNYAIVVNTTTNVTRDIDAINLSGNTIGGAIVNTTIYIHAVGAEINNITLGMNIFNNSPIARGIRLYAQDASMNFINIMGNKVNSGTNEAIYIQGTSGFNINNVTVTGNTTNNGTIGLRVNYVNNLYRTGDLYINASSADTLVQNTTNENIFE